VVIIVGVLGMPANTYVGDPYAWRVEARSLIVDHRLGLEATAGKYIQGSPGQYLVSNPRDGRLYSKYGLLNTVAALAPLSAERIVTGRLPPFESPTRTYFLNAYAIALTLLFALSLYRLALLFRPQPVVCALFVLLSLYTGFAFHYLRYHSSEPLQLLFTCLFFERAVVYYRTRHSREAWLAWIFLAALVFTKISFLVFLPLFSVFVAAAAYREKAPRLLRCAALALLAPILIAALLGAINWYKFGSPWLSGYHQWDVDQLLSPPRAQDFFGQLLLHPQWSLAFNFPLFAVALFGLRRFWRKFPAESALITTFFVVTVGLLSRLGIWRGEWCYGPRYFLFMLPILALPALFLLPGELGEGKRRRLSLTLLMLAWAVPFTALQVEVAALDPFFYYWTRPFGTCRTVPEVADYFERRPYGWIYQNARSHAGALTELPYMPALKSCSDSQYAEHLRLLEHWLRRPNFLVLRGL